MTMSHVYFEILMEKSWRYLLQAIEFSCLERKNKDDEDDNGHVWEGDMFNEVKAKGVDSASII